MKVELLLKEGYRKSAATLLTNNFPNKGYKGSPKSYYTSLQLKGLWFCNMLKLKVRYNFQFQVVYALLKIALKKYLYVNWLFSINSVNMCKILILAMDSRGDVISNL